AVLLSKKESTPRGIWDLSTEQPSHRTITVGVMQAGWFIVFICRHAVLTKGHKPGRIRWIRNIIGPDGIQFVQLIMERVSAIFGREKSRGATKCHIVEARMVGITQNNQTNAAAFPT